MSFSWYGLLLGVAIVFFSWVFERLLLWQTPPAGSPELKTQLRWTIWWVAGGALIGARLYHLATDWSLYQGAALGELFAVWNGGLGIYGGLLGGALGLTAWWKIHHPKISLLVLLDTAAIAAPFGQAVGRWGNYVNQELFGLPTSLPWGIYIDVDHRPAEYLFAERFHPLFLYESIGLLGIGFALWALWKYAHVLFPPGKGLSLAWYFLGYGSLRFSLELLRIHSAPGWFGLSIAQWVSLLVVGSGLLLFIHAFRLQYTDAIPAKIHLPKLLPVRLSSLLAFFLLSCVLAPPVRAQTSPLNLQISPSVVEIAVRPGKTVTQAFLLENKGSVDLVVTPTLRDFTADGTTGLPKLLPTNTFPYAVLENTDISLNEPFTLPAGQSQQLILGLLVLDDAESKDWYFTLLLETKVNQETMIGANSAALASGHIGANVLVRVTQDNQLPLSWEISLDSLPRYLDSLQKLEFTPKVTNTGTTVAAPEMNITILDWRGNIVSEQEGLPDRVLAQSSRNILAKQARKDDPRSFEGIPFRFAPLLALGPYTVRASIRNAAGGPVVVEKTFWALPFVLIGALLACVLIGIGMYIWRRKRLKS